MEAKQQKSLLSKVIARFKHLLSSPSASKTSYSQCGEDLLMEFALKKLDIKKPTYLDLGANDPIRLNNTYYFYKKGSRGVLVEPDPALFGKLKQKRRKDTCLNIGVGLTEAKWADFYIMTWPLFNTLSKERAEEIQNHYQGRNSIEMVIQVPLKNINTIIEENFPSGGPDILSIDIEGIDLAILETLNYEKHSPAIICVENDIHDRREVRGLREFLHSQGYYQYANTHINSIFVKEGKVAETPVKKQNGMRKPELVEAMSI